MRWRGKAQAARRRAPRGPHRQERSSPTTQPAKRWQQGRKWGVRTTRSSLGDETAEKWPSGDRVFAAGCGKRSLSTGRVWPRARARWGPLSNPWPPGSNRRSKAHAQTTAICGHLPLRCGDELTLASIARAPPPSLPVPPPPTRPTFWVTQMRLPPTPIFPPSFSLH